MELAGQAAIVTGAGRGIGRATALELARLGADIVIAELDRANAERTAAEVQTLGRRSSVVPTDVTSRADLTAMVERSRAAFGRIDILVNNAGIYRAALPLDITEEHWDAVMNINARAVFFASQAVLPTMIAQKRGAIISLASMAGKVGSRTLTAPPGPMTARPGARPPRAIRRWARSSATPGAPPRAGARARGAPAAPRLRLVQKVGVGLNTIDLEAAAARGIAVANMPGTNHRPSPRPRSMLILAVLRRLLPWHEATRAGRGWPLDPTGIEHVGELRGRTVGLVGGAGWPARSRPR